MNVLLEASFASKKYNPNSSHTELLQFSMKIKKGEIYVINGKSGSGKTTLLNILGGLDKPTYGKVFFDQRSFYDLSDYEQAKIRGRRYGYIFQSFNLIRELTVFENIELPKHFNRHVKISKSNIICLSDELGIAHLLNKKTNQLSGGEQQRVAVARALITNPEIIFADEPTGNLDENNSRIVADLLTSVVVKSNATLIIVTHEKGLIKHLHNKLIVENGKLTSGD